jgi:hypothetical protein
VQSGQFASTSVASMHWQIATVSLFLNPSSYSINRTICGAPQIVLPDAYHEPSALFQRAVNELVSPFIAGEFTKPELPIIDGHIGVLGAAVPEAAVDENCDFLAPENEIRLTNHFHVTTPSDDVVFAKEPCK